MERTMFLPGRMDWVGWGGLFTETAVWLPIIYRICQQVGLSVNTVEAGYPGTCAVFVVNEGTVVKIYPPMLPHDFARECEVYQQLTGRLAQMPRLLGSGVYRDQLDWPYLLLSFCPGEPIRELYQQLERYSERQLGQELGEMLREVHATPLASLQAFDTRPAACWLVYRHLTPGQQPGTVFYGSGRRRLGMNCGSGGACRPKPLPRWSNFWRR